MKASSHIGFGHGVATLPYAVCDTPQRQPHRRNDWKTTDARVFTPDRLANHIVNQQPQLTRNEIRLIASHLEQSAKSR